MLHISRLEPEEDNLDFLIFLKKFFLKALSNIGNSRVGKFLHRFNLLNRTGHRLRFYQLRFHWI